MHGYNSPGEGCVWFCSTGSAWLGHIVYCCTGRAGLSGTLLELGKLAITLQQYFYRCIYIAL